MATAKITVPLVSELTAPPIVGRNYRVNCVNFYSNASRQTYWVPALSGVHTDPEVGGIATCPHVHFDFRFIGAKLLADVFDITPDQWADLGAKGNQWTVMSYVRAREHGRYEQPDFEFRQLKKRCVREQMEFPVNKTNTMGLPWWNYLTFRLEKPCAGMRLDPANPVCPHRGVRLHDVAVDADGCVTCPGHGLKWNRTTGELVSRFDHIPADVRESIEATAKPTGFCREKGIGTDGK